MKIASNTLRYMSLSKSKSFLITMFVFSVPNAFYIVEGEKALVNLDNRIQASEYVTPKVGRKDKPKGMRATTFCGTCSRSTDSIQEAERYSNYPTPSPDANATPAIPSSAKPNPGEFGTLTIRKKTFALKRGIDEKTLAKDIGCMDTSASPGSDGVCVIMGHRNTQFRVLKDVEKGDTVIITDAAGATHTYIVQSARIVENDSELHFEAGEGENLVLVICYPLTIRDTRRISTWLRRKWNSLSSYWGGE